MRRASTILMLLSASLPLSAQSLDQAAARERQRRETAAARASKVFTEEDLQRYVGQRPPEAASPSPSDQPPAVFDRVADGEAPKPDAFTRHWTSAETYLRQCEERLRVAKEDWLAASEKNPDGPAAMRARRAVESAASALERARQYRDQAGLAARLSGTLPAAGLR